MSKKNRPNYGVFECPVCGNELSNTDKPVIKCRWCKRSVVPRAIHFKREPKVYDNYKRGNRDEED